MSPVAAGAGAGALLLVVLLLVTICCCIKWRKAGAVPVAAGRGPAKSVSVEAEVWRPSVTSSAGRPGTASGRDTAPLKEESYENVTYDTMMERENTYGTGTNYEAGNDYEAGDYENEGSYLA